MALKEQAGGPAAVNFVPAPTEAKPAPPRRKSRVPAVVAATGVAATVVGVGGYLFANRPGQQGTAGTDGDNPPAAGNLDPALREGFCDWMTSDGQLVRLGEAVVGPGLKADPNACIGFEDGAGMTVGVLENGTRTVTVTAGGDSYQTALDKLGNTNEVQVPGADAAVCVADEGHLLMSDGGRSVTLGFRDYTGAESDLMGCEAGLNTQALELAKYVLGKV